jgi:hypothetical protein
MSNPDFPRNGIIGSVSLLAAVAFLLTVVLLPCLTSASDGFLPGDPMVRITAPPALRVDKVKVLEQLSKDVSRASGLDQSLITYYWQTFEEINWNGKRMDSVPVFVDLYVPGFLTDEMVAKIMLSIADSLAKTTGVEKKWVFVHTHTGQQGRVLLNEKVQYFDERERRTDKTLTPAGDLSEDKIVGTWRLISMTYQDKATGKETDLWGKKPIGFLSYTPGGRMSANIAADDRNITAASAGQASIEEQAMLFRNAFGYAGRYTLTKDGVVHHVEVASDPTWIGQDQVRFIRIKGNRLIVTGEPLRTVGDPNLKVLQLIWERIE